MRPVLHGDAVAAARALLLVPRADRLHAMHTYLARADAADRYRKRFGRAHPCWGNGALMAVVQGEGEPPEPPLDASEYCRCLAEVFLALAAWREEKEEFA